MIEFEQNITKYNNYLDKSKVALERVDKRFDKANKIYRNLEIERERTLQNILGDRGLAVCSHPHDFNAIANPSEEQFGIYPRNQMRLEYYEDGPFNIQGEYENSTGYKLELRLCCPEHFPRDRKETNIKSGSYTFIISEVVVDGEKYILQVGGKNTDITDLANSGRRGIEPNGKKPFLVNPFIYKYFGIPDLPEKPKQF